MSYEQFGFVRVAVPSDPTARSNSWLLKAAKGLKWEDLNPLRHQLTFRWPEYLQRHYDLAPCGYYRGISGENVALWDYKPTLRYTFLTSPTPHLMIADSAEDQSKPGSVRALDLSGFAAPEVVATRLVYNTWIAHRVPLHLCMNAMHVDRGWMHFHSGTPRDPRTTPRPHEPRITE